MLAVEKTYYSVPLLEQNAVENKNILKTFDWLIYRWTDHEADVS